MGLDHLTSSLCCAQPSSMPALKKILDYLDKMSIQVSRGSLRGTAGTDPNWIPIGGICLRQGVKVPPAAVVATAGRVNGMDSKGERCGRSSTLRLEIEGGTAWRPRSAPGCDPLWKTPTRLGSSRSRSSREPTRSSTASTVLLAGECRKRNGEGSCTRKECCYSLVVFVILYAYTDRLLESPPPGPALHAFLDEIVFDSSRLVRADTLTVNPIAVPLVHTVVIEQIASAGRPHRLAQGPGR